MIYKGAFILKKIYFALVAAIFAVVMPMQIIAKTPMVSFENDKGEVEVEISSIEKSMSADVVLPGITSCKNPITNTVTVSADEQADIALGLKLSKESTSSQNPLNNYSVTITENGNVVYDSKNAVEVKKNDTSKYIDLGKITSDKERELVITYKLVDDDMDMSGVSANFVVNRQVNANTATAKPVETLKPTFEPGTGGNTTFTDDKFVFDLFKGENGTENNGNGSETKEITKVCGKDIPAGRYVVTGSGSLKITSSSGTEKASYVISDSGKYANAVKQAVVVLEDKDVITITALDGTEKASLSFAKAGAQNAAGTNTSPTPVKPADADKANPKTGDSGVGVIIAIAAVALVALGGLEMLKRKKNN